MTTEKRIFLTLAVIFFLCMHWVGWNETSRFSLTRAIVEEGRMEITSFAREIVDRIRIGGRYYLDKAPGVSLLAVPIHAFSVLIFSTERPAENEDIILRQGREDLTTGQVLYDNNIISPTHLSLSERFSMVMITFLLSGLLTVATAYLLFLFSKEFITDKRIQYLVPIGYALGTLAFPQALVFQGHATSTFFAFAAFFVGYYTVKKQYFSTIKGGILAGALVGIAFLVDYLALFVVAGVGLWFLFSRNLKVFFWYGIAFTAVAGLILIYNFSVFGVPSFLSYAGYLPQAQVEEIEIAAEYFMDGAVSSYFDTTFLWFRIATVFRILFMPERGMFLYFPFLLLAVPGMLFLFRQRPALAIMILIIFFLLLWFLAIPYLPFWHGGSSFGPRQLMLVMPFLMIPVMFAMKKLHIVIPIFLIAASIFINILGLQPPAGLDKEISSMESIKEYHKSITSFAVISNPLVDYYWPTFREYGINMPLINSIFAGKPFDIRSNVFFDERELFVSSTPFGFLFASRFMLPFLIIAIILALIWFCCLRKNLWKYLSVLTFIILIIFSFRLNSDTIYGGGWYEKEEAGRWMKEKAALHIFSHKSAPAVLSLQARSHMVPQVFSVIQGEEEIFSVELSTEPKNFLVPLFLRAGKNDIIFSLEKCFIPAEVEEKSQDKRCLGAMFLGLDISYDIDYELLTTYSGGWYDKEEGQWGQEEGISWRWMSDNAVLTIASPQEKTISLIGTLSSFNEITRELTVYQLTRDRKEVYSTKVGHDLPFNFRVELKKGINNLEFIVNPGCQTSEFDARCLSIVLRNFKIQDFD